MRDVSVRVRTLGRKRGAAILSIGAVFFDRKTGKTGSDFYQEISIASALNGSVLDHEPMKWWADHSVECKALLQRQNTPALKLDLATTLDRFTGWMRNAAAGVPIAWAYGNNDLAILEEAYMTGAVGLSEPWHYTNVRSVLTLQDAAVTARPGFKLRTQPTRVADTALQSAKYQAAIICDLFAALAGKPVASEDDEL